METQELTDFLEEEITRAIKGLATAISNGQAQPDRVESLIKLTEELRKKHTTGTEEVASSMQKLELRVKTLENQHKSLNKALELSKVAK